MHRIHTANEPGNDRMLKLSDFFDIRGDAREYKKAFFILILAFL